MGSSRPNLAQYAIILLITCAAILVHGYHPFVEDAEIYVPGIKKALAPALYPQNAAFFESHAHLTLFPNLIALSVRLTHLPLDWALLAWQFAAIFFLLLACWHFGRLFFTDAVARWGSIALVASLLTIPIAGTALYVMDQYLNTRSISTPAVLFMIVNVFERKFGRAFLWSVFCALIHPLMVVFGVSFAVLWIVAERRPADSMTQFAAALLLLPLGLFPPVTGAYRQVLESHTYFFLLRWEWYEWLGVLGPVALLWWFGRIARHRNLTLLARTCRTLLIFTALFSLAGALVSVPGLVRFAELQPMRGLHLVYIFLFVIGGGLLAQFFLRQHLWRWLLIFLPISAGMFVAQRQLFPATQHLELPGRASTNNWVEAFLWIRNHTPQDAYFALNPDHMDLPGEDQHGFRAIAERSMLADRVKDSGAVTMFPVLAGAWSQQVAAERNWESLELSDFRNLQQKYGVNWFVFDRTPPAGLTCPYQNDGLSVCTLPE